MTASDPLRRGDIVLVELDPVVGAEQGKTRPAIVVSNDGANRAASELGYGVVTVVPLTTNVTAPRAYQALLAADATGLPRDSKAQAEQLRAVGVERVVRRVGRVAGAAMGAVDDAVRVQLAL